MKKLAALLAGAMLMMATSAMALTITPNSLTASNGDVFYDTGAQSVTLSDTDGNLDNATAFLFFEFAGFSNTNKFGIYGFTDNGSSITLGNTLEVFNGTASPVTSATLAFNLSAGTVENMATHVVASIGKNFGFYIDSSAAQGGGVFYTHNILNAGNDHFNIFNTSNSGSGDLFGSDVVLGIEDLLGLGDRDYDDMVIGVTDVTPVPEPGTMVLLGAGLLGLAVFGKRRMNKGA